MQSTKAKMYAQGLAEMKKQSKDLPVFINTALQRIKPKYLGIYNEFHCSTDQPGFLKVHEAYRRKIGALRKYRINKYHLRLEKDAEREKVAFKHLKQFKRLQTVSFYMGRKYIGSGNRLYPHTEVLQGIRKILFRLPRLSNIQLIYPYKLLEISSLRKLRSLNHIILGMNVGDIFKGDKDGSLAKILSRDFKNHRVNSARLICYAAPGAAAFKTKRAVKGKKPLSPSDYLSPKFNHFTRLQKLSVEIRDIETFELFEPVLAAKIFLQLKRLSIQLPYNGFTIESKNETILEQALSLLRILNGKKSKKTFVNKGEKPEISIRGYEDALKKSAEAISALGRVSTITIAIGSTKQNELAEMFSHLKDLKALCIRTFSKIEDWLVSEVSRGIRNIHHLTDLEFYFSYCKFSKESVQEIHSSILHHSASLTKLCMGFEGENHGNDTVTIMNTVLQLPRLSIFKLYLGNVVSYQNTLQPLRHLTQVQRLTELEIAGYYDKLNVTEVGMEFAEILKNLNSLRWLSIKAVWHYEAFYSRGCDKKDLTAIIKNLQMRKKLKGMFVDFDNHTWSLKAPMYGH